MGSYLNFGFKKNSTPKMLNSGKKQRATYIAKCIQLSPGFQNDMARVLYVPP